MVLQFTGGVANQMLLKAMLNVIYCVKAYMLILYTRLTLNHSTQRLVKYLACYVGAGWVATESKPTEVTKSRPFIFLKPSTTVAFFTACTLFEGYVSNSGEPPLSLFGCLGRFSNASVLNWVILLLQTVLPSKQLLTP